MLSLRSILSSVVFSLLTGLLASSSAHTDYHERLHLRPLPQSALLASFNFRSNTSSSSFEQQNFQYFPRSLAQILQHAHAKELHLRFSLGRWDAESWGMRPWGGAKEGGTGVELWAWVEAETLEEANARWTTLTNALSGLFCASLNFIDSTRTTRPVLSFDPAGNHSDSTRSHLHLLHGTLPREPVCTENLTPFLKLLPCKGKAGISSLLDGHKLFDASWQSMSIDVRPLCPPDRASCILEIDQSVDMVLDIERSKRHRSNPIPRPVPAEELLCDLTKPYANSDNSICYPLSSFTSPAPGWTLSEIFGRPMRGSCLISDLSGPFSETVCISVPHTRDVYASVGSMEHKYPSGQTRCLNIPPIADFDLILPSSTIPQPPPPPPPLYAERSFTGHGQERGGVQAILSNPSLTDAITFVYLDILPWFMKPYLHTLTAVLTPLALDLPAHRKNVDPDPVIQQLHYSPSLDRHRPTHLEILLRLPPNTTAVLAYEFEKAILRYTEYPPDANRGFDVASGIIRVLSPASSPASPSSAEPEGLQRDTLQPPDVYIRTPPLLLSLPTPDFSMPYNVIILTSTVMALAFGSVFNLLVRRFVAREEAPRGGLARKLSLLRERVRACILTLQRWRKGDKVGEGSQKVD